MSEKNKIPRFSHGFIEKLDDSPNIVKLFMREIERLGLGNVLKFKWIEFTKDNDTETEEMEIDLIYTVDAAKYARGETYSVTDLENKLERLAKALSIDSFFIFTKFENKKEFAESFLKDLKKQLKLLEVGDCVHQMRFNLEDAKRLTLNIYRKSACYDFGSRSEIRDTTMKILKNMGIENVKVSVS